MSEILLKIVWNSFKELEIFLKIPWNARKNCSEFTWKLRQIVLITASNSLKTLRALMKHEIWAKNNNCKVGVSSCISRKQSQNAKHDKCIAEFYTTTHCLETHMISTSSLAMYFFIANKAVVFPLILPLLPNVERSSHCFVHFLHLPFSWGVHTTVFTKPTVTWNLFDVQTSMDALWKDNELQNMCALLEFWWMALQVRLERVCTSFGTTFVHYPN